MSVETRRTRWPGRVLVLVAEEYRGGFGVGKEKVGSSLGCGMAMLQVPAGESPAQKAASHGSGIEPCRRTSDGALDA